MLPHIQSFIQTYDLPLNELLVEDLTQYPVSYSTYARTERSDQEVIETLLLPILETFNSFFARRLKASARPIDGQDDPRTIVSPADCRMTVFESQDQAKKFWYVPFSYSLYTV